LIDFTRPASLLRFRENKTMAIVERAPPMAHTASNGVNGAPAAPGCLEHEACYSSSGIQYITLLTNLVLEHLTHMQGLG
jgi:hypothetical protein